MSMVIGVMQRRLIKMRVYLEFGKQLVHSRKIFLAVPKFLAKGGEVGVRNGPITTNSTACLCE